MAPSAGRLNKRLAKVFERKEKSPKAALDRNPSNPTPDQDDLDKDLWSQAFAQLDQSKQQIFTSENSLQSTSPEATLKHVIKQTETCYTAYQNRGWKVQYGDGKKIVIRQQMKKILTSALNFKSLIDSAVAFDPSGYASKAWAIVAFSLSLAQNDQDRTEKILESSAFLSSLLTRYGSIECQYLSRSLKDSSNLQQAILEVYVTTLEYAAEVTAAKQAHVAKRTLQAFQALTGQPLATLKTSIVSKDEYVEKWIPLISHEYRLEEFQESNKKADELLDALDSIAPEISSIKERIRTQDEESLLMWISSFNVSSTYNRFLNMKESGTGEWMLSSKEFESWQQTSTHATPKLFWLYGQSGCGKTLLSSTIIEYLYTHCQREKHALAYWYFDINDNNSQMVDICIRSVIRQLAASLDHLPPDLGILEQEFRAAGRDPSSARLLDVLQAVVTHDPREKFIVFDAIDECPYSSPHVDRKDLLNVFTTLGQLQTPNLHVLLTSRREFDIEKVLDNIAAEVFAVENCFFGDLQLFVDKQLQDPLLQRWSDATRVLIKSTLIKPEFGNFRWTALQLDALKDCHDDEEIQEALVSIPPTLGETYERVVSRLSKKDLIRARKILAWLLFAKRPLALIEVAKAADLPFPEDVLRICSSSLITICTAMINVGTIWIREIDLDNLEYQPNISFGPMNMVKIAHASVYDHFCSAAQRQPEQPMPSVVSVSEMASHREIAKQCMSCLLSLGPKRFEDLSIGVSNRVIEIRKAIKDSYSGNDGPFKTTRQHLDNKLGAVDCKSLEWFQHLSSFRYSYVWDTRHEAFCNFPLFVYSTKYLCAHLQKSHDPSKPDPAYNHLLEDFFCKDEPPVGEIWLNYCAADFGRLISYVSIRPVSPFYAACFMGWSSVVERLWSSHNCLKSIRKEGRYGNGLEAALGEGHYDIYQYLVREGAPSLLPEADPAIVTAAGHYEDRAIQRLLCADCPITFDLMTKVKAFKEACRFGNAKVVALFLEAGMDVSPEGPANGAILEMRGCHDTETLFLLINAGADVNVRRTDPDAFGRINALHDATSHAMSYRAVERTRILLAAGADVSVRDAKGRSPLQLARNEAKKPRAQEPPWLRKKSLQYSQQIVEILIRAGAWE